MRYYASPLAGLPQLILQKQQMSAARAQQAADNAYRQQALASQQEQARLNRELQKDLLESRQGHDKDVIGLNQKNWYERFDTTNEAAIEAEDRANETWQSRFDTKNKAAIEAEGRANETWQSRFDTKNKAAIEAAEKAQNIRILEELLKSRGGVSTGKGGKSGEGEDELPGFGVDDFYNNDQARVVKQFLARPEATPMFWNKIPEGSDLESALSAAGFKRGTDAATVANDPQALRLMVPIINQVVERATDFDGNVDNLGNPALELQIAEMIGSRDREEIGEFSARAKNIYGGSTTEALAPINAFAQNNVLQLNANETLDLAEEGYPDLNQLNVYATAVEEMYGGMFDEDDERSGKDFKVKETKQIYNAINRLAPLVAEKLGIDVADGLDSDEVDKVLGKFYGAYVNSREYDDYWNDRRTPEKVVMSGLEPIVEGGEPLGKTFSQYLYEQIGVVEKLSAAAIKSQRQKRASTGGLSR